MDNTSTRHRLLEAAGQVFAEVGFRSARVREICERASANVAAINYHFGDKEKLYLEVFRYVHAVDCGQGTEITSLDFSNNPKEALRLFILQMLRKMLLPGKFSWKGQLLAREMAEPSPALDEVVSFWMKPISDTLNSIVAALLEAPLTDPRVRTGASSIFGQCYFHKHGFAVNQKLYPDLVYSEDSITELAEHIYLFSLGGLTMIKGAPL